MYTKAFKSYYYAFLTDDSFQVGLKNCVCFTDMLAQKESKS